MASRNPADRRRGPRASRRSRIERLDENDLRVLEAFITPTKDGRPRKLTEVAKLGIPGRDSPYHVAGALDRVQDVLRREIGRDVKLYEVRGRARRPTDAALDLLPVVSELLEARRRERRQQDRLARLEDLKLATRHDRDRPLRIGAYPAHVERLLGRAGERMRELFPDVMWRQSTCSNRQRRPDGTGELRSLFDRGEFDFMLAPSDDTTGDVIYKYSLRVVADQKTIKRLSEGETANTIHISRLREADSLVMPPANMSSRLRLARHLLEHGMDLDDGSWDIVEEDQPATMVARATAGEGVAVMSDEYNCVGSHLIDFPLLRLGCIEDALPETYVVPMILVAGPEANAACHNAFRFVVDDLIEMEREQPRAAAQTPRGTLA
jgi:hypothetical protein